MTTPPVQELRDTLRHVKDQVSSQADEIATLSLRLDEMQRRALAAEYEARTLMATVSQLDSEIGTLKAKRDEQAKRALDVLTRETQWAEQIEAAESQVAAQAWKISGLEEKLATRDGQLAAAVSERDTWHQLQAWAIKDLAARVADLSALRQIVQGQYDQAVQGLASQFTPTDGTGQGQ